MQLINAEYTKIEDDEVCALLKPYNNKPPVTDIANQIWDVLCQFPEIKERIKLRLNSK